MNLELYNQLMFSFYFFIVGCAVGSFLNVLIDRLSNEESIMGRSHCDFCNHQLSWADLIPVVSFIWLKGKCRYCKKKLSPQYWLIEILTGTVFVLVLYFLNLKSPLFFDHRLATIDYRLITLYILTLALSSVFLVIFIADVKYQIIPDEMQITFFVCSLGFHFFAKESLMSWGMFALGGILTALPIVFLYVITKGRGMGFGDVKLAFNIGFLLGIKGGIVSLYVGFILGAFFGLLLIFLKKRKLRSKIAFGPFLLLGILTLLLWQKQIFELIMRLYGV